MTGTARTARTGYLLICLLLTATVLGGFGPGYFWPLVSGSVTHFWFIHMHAAVFLGWTLLLLAQAVIVVTGHIELHRTVGIGGALWGVVVILVGLFISVAAPAARMEAGQLEPDVAGLVVAFNLTDMVAFIGFFSAAIGWRSRPVAHRRLMVFAATALTGAAVGRVLASDSVFYLIVWLVPAIAALVLDWKIERRVPVIYAAAFAVFLFMFVKVEFYSTLDLPSTLGLALIRMLG